MIYTNKLFESIKDSKFARLNSLKFLMQRFLFCIISLIPTFNIDYVKISLFSSIQFISFLYIVIIRPFENVKENLFEIINDSFYFVLCVLLLYLNESSHWTRPFQIVYMCIILSNNIVVFIISLTFSICQLLKKICKVVKITNSSRISDMQQNTRYDDSVVRKVNRDIVLRERGLSMNKSNPSIISNSNLNDSKMHKFVSKVNNPTDQKKSKMIQNNFKRIFKDAKYQSSEIDQF